MQADQCPDGALVENGECQIRKRKDKKTYQGESGLVLVEGPDAGPVEGLQQFDARRVEGVLARDDAEKVGVTLAREHGVRVGVRELVITTPRPPFIKWKTKEIIIGHPTQQRKREQKRKWIASSSREREKQQGTALAAD